MGKNHKMFCKKKPDLHAKNSVLTLKDFISKSLDDICEAVKESREKHSFIAPQFFVDPSGKEKATNVDFDIAVTVTDEHSNSRNLGAEASGKMQIAVVSADAKISEDTQKSKNASYSKVSRITFSVPVYFQLDEERRKHILEQQRKQMAEIEKKTQEKKDERL